MTMSTEHTYRQLLGQRIRAIRIQQGLSLARVDEKSGGRFQTAVLGSYERADRSITMVRLAELAEFYGVPVVELLPGPPGPVVARPPRIRFDLPALEQAPSEAESLRRWTFAIRQLRGDWGGQVLTVRTADLVHIAALLATTPGAAVGLLTDWDVLLEVPDRDAVELELANTTGTRR